MKIRVAILVGGNRKSAVQYLHDIGNEYVDIVSVIFPVPTAEDNPFVPVIEYVKKADISHRIIEYNELLQTLKMLDYDVLISLGWRRIINEECIAQSKYAINVHPTLLPKYRGFRSGPFILINGEKESGVTVHFIEKELDRGDIIEQVRFDLTPFDTPMSLKRKIDETEGKALLMALRKLGDGFSEFIVQNEEEASQYDEIRTPKDSVVDWEKPLKDLYNSIRACDPEKYPAHFFVNGEKVCIKLWRPEKPDDESDMI